MQISNNDPNFLERFFGLFNKKNQRKQYFDNRINYQITKGEVYIDTHVPYDLYNTIPQLRTPVDKLAAMFSNGVFKYQKVGSDKLEPLPTDIAKLLENPNLLQGQNPFLNQYLRQLIVYGNQFIYKNSASKITTTPQSLINVSPVNIKPKLTGKLFDQVTLDGIVSGYEYDENGSKKSFETTQILWSKISDLDNNLVGYSPLKAMKYPLSNTVVAYQYLNCISSEKGGIGVLSSQSKDAMGALPMTPEEKKELEQTYRNENGIEEGQKKIHITTGSVTWSPMSYPTKDLLLMEQIDANFLSILNVLGVNQNLFINSTYENLKHGLVQTHNDTVMVYADGFTQALSKFIGIPETHRLILDYSHLPYLQTDRKQDAETFNTVSNSLNTLVSGGIITNVQASEVLANQFGLGLKK
jgi:phage portal protein BeeE